MAPALALQAGQEAEPLAADSCDGEDRDSSDAERAVGWRRPALLAGALAVGVALGALVAWRGGLRARPALRYDRGITRDSEGRLPYGGAGDFGEESGYVPAAGPTLFCFALVFPAGPEFELMQMLLQKSMGPFACDGHNIYSNESVLIGTNPRSGYELMTSSVGGGSLDAEMASRWRTALNTAVFVRVWNAVSSTGQYLDYDWSVKLDADCVFLPQRLRSILIGIDPFMPAYLENCAYGLHGPIEVVNRLAMRYFLVGQSDCQDIYTKGISKEPMMFDTTLHDHLPPDGGVWVADSLEHGFGEDVYLQKCLAKHRAHMIKAHGMLAEEACKIQASPCSSPDVVAFHPFKDPESYLKCVDEAKGSGRLTDVLR